MAFDSLSVVGPAVAAHLDPLRGPLAAQIPVVLPGRLGTQPRIDPYAWLRDDNPHVKRPEILAQLEAENAWTAAQTAHLAALRVQLTAELSERIRDDDRSVPCYRRGWWFESRYEPGAEHPQHVRRRGTREGPDPTAPEQLLLDEQVEAAGREAFMLGDIAVSPDDRLLAWTEDSTGRRSHRLRIRDLGSGQMLADTIDGVLEGFQWAADSETLFYVRQDPQRLQSGPVCRHTLGMAVNDDTQVFHEDDEAMFVSLAGTSSRRYILICIEGDDSTEIRAVASHSPHAAPHLVLPRRFGVRLEVDHLKDLWVILTNEHARGFRLVQAPAEAPADRRRWIDLAPHQRGVVLEDFVLFEHAIVLQERAEANTRLRVLPWSANGYNAPDRSEPARKTLGGGAPGGTPGGTPGGGSGGGADAARETDPLVSTGNAAQVPARTIATEESAFTMSIDDNPDPSASHLRYSLTSMVTPVTIYDIDLASGARTLRHVAPVGGFSREHYATARLWAHARDGREVPVSIAWRQLPAQATPAAAADARREPRANMSSGLGADHQAEPSAHSQVGPRRNSSRRPVRARQAARLMPQVAPPSHLRALLLTAYGAYGDPFDPVFDAEQVSLMDRGFAVAIAHVRGGNELGEDWYDEGRLDAKMNSFTDFIDVTRFLVRKGWAPRDRVFAEGGSAGGLLMAAVANMAGELYRGMLLQVPFVDVLTTMLDDDLPLTTQERCEWGDPRQKADFDAIRAWSPYDNLRAKVYPAMLVTAALHDAQVPVHEPAKYVAKLRALKSTASPLLLQVEMQTGHAGRAGRFARLSQRALEFAFLLNLANNEP